MGANHIQYWKKYTILRRKFYIGKVIGPFFHKFGFSEVSYQINSLGLFRFYHNVGPLYWCIFFYRTRVTYCLFVWMSHSETLNNRIFSFHERFVRSIYNNKHLSFQCLLDGDRSVSIHTSKLEILATQIFKHSKNILQKYLLIFGSWCTLLSTV